MEKMGMDPATGMSAADVAKSYKAAVEGEFDGDVLDVREISLHPNKSH